MNNYFKKINVSIPNKVNPGDILHTPNNQGLSYYEVLEKEYLKSILKINVPYKVFYCIMIGPGKLYPHIDKQSSAAINYYIDPADGETIFYEPLSNEILNRVEDGKIINNSFYDKDLVKKDSFIAESKDCFILNVSKIHNVFLPSTKPRHFINFAFQNIKFEDLKKLF